MWVLYCCYMIAMLLLCGWHVVAMMLLWCCYEVALCLLCSCFAVCYVVAMWLVGGCYAQTWKTTNIVCENNLYIKKIYRMKRMIWHITKLVFQKWRKWPSKNYLLLQYTVFNRNSVTYITPEQLKFYRNIIYRSICFSISGHVVALWLLCGCYQAAMWLLCGCYLFSLGGNWLHLVAIGCNWLHIVTLGCNWLHLVTWGTICVKFVGLG